MMILFGYSHISYLRLELTPQKYNNNCKIAKLLTRFLQKPSTRLSKKKQPLSEQNTRKHCLHTCINHQKKNKIMDKYVCTVCNYVYDPELGDPESGIAPGTAFEDLPEDWVCPLCGVGKDEFEKE